MHTLEEFSCSVHTYARVCLHMQWGRVAADASWYDKMVADPVSCAWLGNILISDWLSCIAIRTDVMTDAVFRETCAIRRERVLRLVLVSLHAHISRFFTHALPPSAYQSTASVVTYWICHADSLLAPASLARVVIAF